MIPATKLKSIGVKIGSDVDKSGFQKIADPYLDRMSADFGPHTSKIKSDPRNQLTSCSRSDC